MTILPTTFELRLPHAIEAHLKEALHKYAKQMVVQPQLIKGKVVIEENDFPIGGITHTVRYLVTADFEPDKTRAKRLVSNRLPGSAPPQQPADEPYWESWMVALAGRATGNENGGFEVLQTQVYRSVEGGWQLVYDATSLDQRVSAPLQITSEGDVWPEAAGEPPANIGYIHAPQPRPVPEIEAFQMLLNAGAKRMGDEIAVDMRVDAQRKLFWQIKSGQL